MSTAELSQWQTLQQQAAQGEAQAQFEVACHYEWGWQNASGQTICDVDPIQALHWYRAAAAQGQCHAQSALGRILSYTHDGIEADAVQAQQYLQLAIAQGDAIAAFNLGTLYRDTGKLEWALRQYQLAARMGHHDAWLEIALCHLFGIGTRRNAKRALYHLQQLISMDTEQLAPATVDQAHYWSGVVHLLGLGGKPGSQARARQWLERANADEDHASAQDLLNLLGRSSYRIHPCIEANRD